MRIGPQLEPIGTSKRECGQDAAGLLTSTRAAQGRAAMAVCGEAGSTGTGLFVPDSPVEASPTENAVRVGTSQAHATSPPPPPRQGSLNGVLPFERKLGV